MDSKLKCEFLKAYGWLQQDEGLEMPVIASQLVGLLNELIEKGQHEEAWDNLAELYNYCKKGAETEYVEAATLVECARAAVELGDSRRAKSLLEEAIGCFGLRKHHAAFASWMLGMACWALDERSKALASWDTSLSTFSNYSTRITIDQEARHWYQQCWEEMKSFVEDALAQEYSLKQNQSEDPTHGKVRPSDATNQPKRKSDQASPAIGLDYFSLMPVSGSIPAGAWSGAVVDPYPEAFVETSEVLINNQRHRVVSLGGSHEVIVYNPAGRGAHHFVLRVTSDSMVDAGIETGDYVVIRSDGEDAPHLAIVAVEIVGADGEANLKRLDRSRVGEGIIAFRPENKSGHYEPKQFDLRGHNVSFKIWGIAIAVLKPLPPE